MPASLPASLPVSLSLPARPWLLFSLLVLVSVLSVAACSSGEESPSRNLLDLRFFSSDGLGLPITDTPIDALRVTVVDSVRQEVITRKILTKDTNGQSTLYDIPYGEDLQFFIEGLDTDDNVLASGGTRALDFLEDGTTARLYALMTPPNQARLASALFGGGEVGPSEFTDITQPGGGITGLAGHQAVTLQDGRVLVIGGATLVAPGQGIGGSDMASLRASVLIYDINNNGGYFDPAINSDDGEPLRLSTPRAYHTATLLPDGSVLIAGGFTTFNGTDLSTQITVDLITPTTNGEFILESIGATNVGRARHTATLIEGGEVLLVGGETIGTTQDSRQYLNVVERFDPDLGTTSITLTMSSPRSQHSAAALDSRQVLICGGRTETTVLSDCEVYVQVGAAAQMIALTSMQSPRYAHAALPLPDREGQVVIAGGYTDLAPGQLTGSVEVFDRELGSFDPSRALALTQARAELQLIDLHRDRKFLAIGGISVQGLAVAGVDLFEPLSSRGDSYFVEQIASLTVGRFAHSSTLLTNGMILTTGGATKPDPNTTSTLSTSDIINLGPPSIVTNTDE
jgi:hypothetical protein